MAKPKVQINNSFNDWRVITNLLSDGVGDLATLYDQTIHSAVDGLNDLDTRKFNIAGGTVFGNLNVVGTLNASSDFAINTNKFSVTALSGNTSIAGTLAVTGATTLSSTLNVASDITVGTNKFIVTSASGNTSVAGTLSVAGTSTLALVSATALTSSGDLTLIGTGRRILSDFSNATPEYRTLIQSNVLNGDTVVSVIPNGTSSFSSFTAYNSSTPSNSSRGQLQVTGTQVQLRSDINGTGTYLPLSFYTSSVERLSILANGNVGVGTTSPDTTFNVKGILHISDGTTSSYIQSDNTWGMKWQFAGASDTVEMNLAETAWKFNIASGGVTKYRFNASKTGGILGPIVDFNVSGSSIFYGQVGIGETSPTAALSFVASTTAAGGISFGGDTTLYRQSANTIATGGNFTFAGGGYLTMNTATILLGVNGFAGSGDIVFRSAGAPSSTINPVFRIKDSTGALQDGLRFNTAWVNSVPGSLSSIAIASVLGMPIYTISATSSTSNINFNTNVGIGTSNPADKLVIWGGGQTIQSTTAGVGARLTLSDTNNTVSIETSPIGVTTHLIFKTSTAERVRIWDSGLVTFNNGITVTGTSTFNNGIAVTGNASASSHTSTTADTITTPSFNWSGDLTTGLYHPGNSQIGITLAGISRAVFSNAGLTVSNNVNATGFSTLWGTTNTTATGAINTVMGISNSATWLVSGTSGGVFRAGIQAHDADGTLRLYAGTAFIQISNTGAVSGASSVSATSFVGALTGNASTVTTNANLTGEVTSAGNTTTVVNATVIGKVLTGYISGAGVVAATDTILQAIQKLNANDATNANLTGMVTSVGNATTVITNANLTGEVTSVGNATTVVNATVIGKVLTGYISGAGVVASTDTILQAIQKLNANDATNANLTGMVTSVGNATTVITNANLTGEVTSIGNTTTVPNATVIGKVLTGFVSGAGVISATDNILSAVQKLNGNTALKAPIIAPIFSGVVGVDTLRLSNASTTVLEFVAPFNGTTIPSGYLKLVTPIRTVDNQMFSIDIVGYDYNLGKSIDFTVVGYAYAASDAIIHLGFSNRSSFARQIRAVLETRGGADRYLVIAMGAESSAGNCTEAWYFQKLTATVRVWNGLAPTIQASQFSWVAGEITLAAGYDESANLNNLTMDGQLGTVSAATSMSIAGNLVWHAGNLTKASIGLGNVDNTSDVNKPVSTAQAAADSATLVSANAYADTLVVGLWDDRGSFNASVNTYPTTGGSGAAGAILKGDIWTINIVATAGVLLDIALGSTVRAMVNAPAQVAANWDVLNVGLGYVPLNAASNLSDLTNLATARTNLGVPTGSGTSTGTNTGDQTNISGNAATVTTNANLTGEVTSVGNATTVGNATVIGKVLTGYISGAGVVAATDTILQAIQKLNANNATNANLTGMVTSVGNATTVVTNANLTGEVTSVGNATAVLNATVIGKVLTGYISGAGTVASTDTILQAIQKLNANDATNANLTGMVTSVGNATTVVTNANLTGDVTSTGNATTVGKINGTSLAVLGTGILKNTTTTGVPSIAVAGDFPVLNQSTTGNAATVTTNANLTGEVTSVGNATTVPNATVIGKVLTGFISGSGVVAATDTILQAVNKLDGNIALRATIISPTFTTPNIGVATGASFNSITGLSSTAPLMNGAVAIGTGTTVARSDHVHASDTSRALLAGSSTQAFNTSSLTTTGDISQQNATYLKGKTAAAVATRLFGMNVDNTLYIGGIDTLIGDTLFVNNGSLQAQIFAASGNVKIGGGVDSGYKLEVVGSFAATTKSFLIDHPTKEGMKLRYGSLEGPENGVYVRGKVDDANVIELPDYWTGLVESDSITVSLTAIGNGQELYVEDIKDNKVYIGSNSSKKIKCFYVIYGERKDVDKLVVEF